MSLTRSVPRWFLWLWTSLSQCKPRFAFIRWWIIPHQWSLIRTNRNVALPRKGKYNASHGSKCTTVTVTIDHKRSQHTAVKRKVIASWEDYLILLPSCLTCPWTSLSPPCSYVVIAHIAKPESNRHPTPLLVLCSLQSQVLPIIVIHPTRQAVCHSCWQPCIRILP